MVWKKIYGKTSEQLIFIIDEWDCILRDKRYSSADVEKYLDFLRDLLKDQSYVALAYMTGRFGSYRTRTETYEALQIYIDMNYDGLKDAVIKMISGEKVLLDVETFQNDMSTFHTKDDVLTLLVHLGYLAYDMNEKNVYIPNAEVQAEFLRSVKRSQWNDVIKSNNVSASLNHLNVNE